MLSGLFWNRCSRYPPELDADAAGRCVKSSTRSSSSCAGAARGACCPSIFRRIAWFARFRDDGTWQTVNHHLLMLDRERVGREATPSTAVMDSQSAKTTEAGGPRGYDAAKKVKGRKRHALVDTDGRALLLQVSP